MLRIDDEKKEYTLPDTWLTEPLELLDLGLEKQEGTDGYYQLVDNNNLVFAASIPTPDNALSLTINDIKSGFELIHQE